MRPYLKKKPITKKGAGRAAQGVGPEFKPQYRKKEIKINEMQTEMQFL
jgi:hypothetical protein